MGSRRQLLAVAQLLVLLNGCARNGHSSSNSPDSIAVLSSAEFGAAAATFSEEPARGNQRCIRLTIRDAESLGPLCFLSDRVERNGVDILFSTANTPKLPDQFLAGFAGSGVQIELSFAGRVLPVEVDPVTGFFAFREKAEGLLERLTAARDGKLLSVCERSAPSLVVDLVCLPQ
jgi:hypothetical protein